MDNAVALVRAYLQLNGYFTITIAVWKDDPVLYEAVKDPQNVSDPAIFVCMS